MLSFPTSRGNVKLPDSLSRKAIIQTFDRITPVAWERLFAREDCNGLCRLRVVGDFKGKTYYSTDGLIHWLVRNDRYTIVEIRRIVNGAPSPSGLTIRTHVLA